MNREQENRGARNKNKNDEGSSKFISLSNTQHLTSDILTMAL